ncbi:hypothetical protein, partial [Nitrospira sp. BLG_1]|uniref:hypothetical protein n=1 Tax=Nitrospira sp. BLG_1 TaxID=3395883 RepID=UPI0039BD8384
GGAASDSFTRSRPTCRTRSPLGRPFEKVGIVKKKKLIIYLPTPRSNKFAYAVTCPYCYHGWGSNHKDNICPKCNGIFDDSDFQQKLLNFKIESAQQKMHPTKNGRGKSDKVSTPAVFGWVI